MSWLKSLDTFWVRNPDYHLSCGFCICSWLLDGRSRLTSTHDGSILSMARLTVQTHIVRWNLECNYEWPLTLDEWLDGQRLPNYYAKLHLIGQNSTLPSTFDYVEVNDHAWYTMPYTKSVTLITSLPLSSLSYVEYTRHWVHSVPCSIFILTYIHVAIQV